MPSCHELDDWVVAEELVLAETAEEVVLVDEAVEGSQFALAYHSVPTYRDIIASFFLLPTDFELIDAGDFHVEELLAL